MHVDAFLEKKGRLYHRYMDCGKEEGMGNQLFFSLCGLALVLVFLILLHLGALDLLNALLVAM